MVDRQSGHRGEDSALISWQRKSLALGLKKPSEGGRDQQAPLSHAAQHGFHELETFTVTMLQGEDPYLSARELAGCPYRTLTKGGRGVSTGVLYWLVCVCNCAQVYTNLPSST